MSLHLTVALEKVLISWIIKSKPVPLRIAISVIRRKPPVYISRKSILTEIGSEGSVISLYIGLSWPIQVDLITLRVKNFFFLPSKYSLDV